MIESRASFRYAKAILEHARQTGRLEEMIEDFRTLDQAVSESRELRMLLERPTIQADKKASILEEIFRGKVSDGTLSFLTLLAAKERSRDLPGVIVSFRNQIDVERGVAVARIESAHELDDPLRQRIESDLSKMTGKTIDADWQIRPELIGGFTARVGDMMVDASVRRQLERLRDTLAADAGTWTPTL